MTLFIIEDLKVMPHPSTLLIHPFGELWELDMTVKKDRALKQFAYIEFMCSYDKANPFIDYGMDIRSDKIINAIDPNNDQQGFHELVLIDEGVKLYTGLQEEASPTVAFYEAALQGAEQLKKFFGDVDLTLVTRTGTPVHKPADVTRALKDTNEIVKTLGGMKETIYSETAEASKGKGGRTINFFEKSTEDR